MSTTTALESWVGMMLGCVTLAGQSMSDGWASSGPSTMVMHPGSFGKRPCTVSLTSLGRNGHSVGALRMWYSCKMGHVSIVPNSS